MLMFERLSQIRRNRVVRNIVALGLGQGANYLLPLASIPFLLHTLGSSAYGDLAFTQATVAIFSIIVGYGFNMSATKEVAEHRENKDYVARVNATVIGLQLLLATIGFGVVLLLIGFVPTFNRLSAIFLVAYISVFGGVFSARYLFQGYETMQAMTIVDVSCRAVGVLLLFVFVRNQTDVLLAMFLLSSGSLLAPVAFTVLAVKQLGIPFGLPRRRYAIEQLREGWAFFVSSLGGVLFNQGNVVILGMLSTPSAVGLFAAAEKVIKAACMINVPITQAVYPRAMHLASTNETQFVLLVKKLLSFQTLLLCIPTLILLLFPNVITAKLLNISDGKAIYVILMLSPIPILTALGDVLGVILMVGRGFRRQFSRQIVIAGVANMLLMIFLVPLLGALGAAISVLSVEAFLALTRINFAVKNGLLKSNSEIPI